MKTLYQQRQLGNARGNPLRDYFATQEEVRRRNSPLSIEEEVEIELSFLVKFELTPVKINKRKHDLLSPEQRRVLYEEILDETEKKSKALHLVREAARIVSRDYIKVDAKKYEESGELR